MPIYPYECGKCSHQGEHFQRLKDKPIDKCPACKSKKYARVFTEPNAIVRGLESVKTFGQAAEENARRLGRGGMEALAEADKARVSKFKRKLPKGASINTTAPATPPWRDGSMGLPKMDKPLDMKKLNTAAKRNKYIKTGKV